MDSDSDSRTAPSGDTGQLTVTLSKLSRAMRSVELPLQLTYERLSALGTTQLKGPLSLTRLAESEKVSRATMSRIVAALEKQELVRRLPDKRDGRGVIISATAKGRQVFKRAVDQSMRQILSAVGSLHPDEIAMLRVLFQSLEGRGR